MKKFAIIVCVLAIASPSLGGVDARVGVGGGSGIATKPNMVLTDTAFVAVGREINLYWTELAKFPVQGPPFFFSVDTGDYPSALGKMRDDRWRWRPGDASGFTATINAHDYAGKRVESKSMVVKGTDVTAGSGVKTTLFVGDSILADGVITAEVDSLFSTGGGGNILPIGSESDDVGGVAYFHEGRGGKTWEWFTSASGGNNPFWIDGRLDFQSYVADTLGFGTDIDYVVAHLGGNEAWIAGDRMTGAEIAEIVASATAFADTLFSATYGYPTARLLVAIMPTANARISAWSYAYGSDGRMTSYVENIKAIASALISAFDGGAYSNRVDVCYAGLWVDNVNGYPTANDSTRVVTGTSSVNLYGTDYLHPSTAAKKQMADAIYSHLVRFQELDDEQQLCTNEVVDSADFTNATYWTDISTYFTPTTGQADPWSGTSATLFTATASVTNFVYAAGGGVVVDDANVVFSGFINRGTMGTDENSAFRIVDGTDSAFAQVRVNWLATPTVTGSGALDTAVGITDLGGDWYQVWVYMDATGRTGNTFAPRFSPMESGGDEGDTVYIAGVQLEFGVTTPCGTYVEKP